MKEIKDPLARGLLKNLPEPKQGVSLKTAALKNNLKTYENKSITQEEEPEADSNKMVEIKADDLRGNFYDNQIKLHSIQMFKK